MLWVTLLLSFIHARCGGSTPTWGSSVVTVTQGPSPLLVYETEETPEIYVNEVEAEIGIEIRNGKCFIFDKEVGQPCSITKSSTKIVTEIQLSSVTNYTLIYLLAEHVYTTYFAPNCVFPILKEAIPKASLPLSRFMKGHDKVAVTFAAFAGQRETDIILSETGKAVCTWTGSELLQGNETFCQLESQKNDTELWFNGIFEKGNASRSVYEWWVGYNVVSVAVDWTQTGGISPVYEL